MSISWHTIRIVQDNLQQDINIKILKDKSTRGMEDLYAKNHRKLLREIKGLNKW